MSGVSYGNAPLPPPSPSQDVTPRSHSRRLNGDYVLHPVTKAKLPAQPTTKRDVHQPSKMRTQTVLT